MFNAVAKEKSDKIFLLEAGNAFNSGLLTSFSKKSSKILDIFTCHLNYTKISTNTCLNIGVQYSLSPPPD
jgi:hypothetical protein